MTTTPDSKPKSRRHVHIYDEDWELLQQLYGAGSANRIGASEAVRKIIHHKCLRLRQLHADSIDVVMEQRGDGDDAMRQESKGVIDI